MKFMFTLITVALFCVSAGTFYYQVQLFFVNRASVESEEFANTFVEGIQISKSILEEKLQEKTDRVIELQYSLNDQKEKNTDLSKKLSAKVSESLELKSEIRRLKSGMENLQKNHAKLMNKNNILKEENQKMTTHYDEISQKFKEVQQQHLDQKTLIENTRELTFSSPGVSIPVRQSHFKREKKTNGNVVKYDKEFNLLVVDLGQIDGLSVGSVLDVRRENNIVSRIRIEKVFPYFSSGAIIGRFIEILPNDKIDLPEI